MHSLQLDELPISVLAPAAPPSNTSANIPPLFYRGLFQVDNAEGKPALNLDTFLSLPDGVKGVVWVNGHKLGRYWRIGPQQSLYVPGCILTSGQTRWWCWNSSREILTTTAAAAATSRRTAARSGSGLIILIRMHRWRRRIYS